ncbi:MAG: serine hydrolase [Steroidobacteraceae bacterium]
MRTHDRRSLLLVTASVFAWLLSGCGRDLPSTATAETAQDALVIPAFDSTIPLTERPLVHRLGFWAPAEQVRGYMAMETIFPTKPIRAGGTVHPLLESPRPIIGNFVFENRPYTVDDLMASSRASGLIVVKDGEIVIERYGLGRKPTDRWTSFSVVKPLTSTLVGAAIKDGYIRSVDDPLDMYIPELKGGTFEGVTLRNAMRMSSGSGWVETYDDPESHFNLYATNPGPEFYKLMSSLPRQVEQGTRYAYSTGDTNLVGVAVINATGKGLAEYASEKIWKPYGMEADGVWMTSRSGLETGGICYSATLRDVARFGMFVLDNGKIDGKDVLPPNWFKEATTPSEGSPIYGYNWRIDEGGQSFRHAGIFGQLLYINPEMNMVIVINSAWRKASNPELRQMHQAFIDAVIEELKARN